VSDTQDTQVRDPKGHDWQRDEQGGTWTRTAGRKELVITCREGDPEGLDYELFMRVSGVDLEADRFAAWDAATVMAHHMAG
jgi:hypothetical protein